MKWLKIKKYLKIFSVIICSIFIFSNKASALENTIFYDINTTKDKLLKYQEDYNNGRNIFNDIDLIINELNDNRTYDYFITAYYNSSFNVDFNIVIVPKNTELNTISSGSYAMKTYFYNLKLYNAPKVKYIHVRYNINATNLSLDFYNTNYSTFDDLMNYLKNEKNNFTFNDTFSGELINGEYNYNGITDNIMTVNNMLYYSTLDIPFNNLDSSGNVYNLYINNNLLKNNDNIPKLIDYFIKENPLKYRMQFNNDVSPDLKQITFDFSSYEFTEGSNPVKTKIEMGSNSLLEEEIPNYLNSYIYGYGTDGVKYDMSEYIDFTIDTTNYLTTKELTFTYTLKKEIPKDILRIFIYYDFETINNNYFFNVFDNATWGSVFWEYIENFLVGYKKYTFPEGYDLAIIRSKSFKDLESFYISDKVYFTNTDYDFNLKLYDFKNKIEKYNFNSLTQYLINPVYLKIPIKIDETNNIFPVLTKPMNNESGVFYLKNDLFVQFVNSENLDSIIDGIPEDDFNDNNDLNIDSDIGNLNPPQQDEQSLTVFFNEFWKMFEKFSDILSYITSCFTQFFISLPTTIQFFLCISFAFVIYKMIVFFIL